MNPVKQQRNILVTNDDGIYSPGLAALAEIAADFGKVKIVAPDVERSSSGHSISSDRPISYRATPEVVDGRIDAYRVNGTPADCVALGAHLWSEGPVDAVLSGINLGYNLGNSIWHSGTISAARQATLLKIPGIAFSTHHNGEKVPFEKLAGPLREILAMLLDRLPHWNLVNVNVPHEVRGVLWTQQSVRHYDNQIVGQRDPVGRMQYWFTIEPVEDVERGTDRWAVENGFASINPLGLDLTDWRSLEIARGESVEGAAPTGG